MGFYFLAGARLFEEQCVKDHSVPSQCGDCGEIGVKTGTRVSVKPGSDASVQCKTGKSNQGVSLVFNVKLVSQTRESH